MTQLERYNLIDWMKAIGMFLIVLGHVFGYPFNDFTVPINMKQLGVTCFVFVIGWGLAKEKRTAPRVIFNRLFSVYFWGLLFAILLSVIYFFTKHDTNPSNYLPFIFGVNVFLNSFPANPTTWYIGTYIHIILFWAFFLKNKDVRPWMFIAALLVELLCRSVLIYYGRFFTAYMLLPNWATVFFLGMLLAQRKDLYPEHTRLIVFSCVFVFYSFAWRLLMQQFEFSHHFPFGILKAHNLLVSTFVSSFLVTIVYLVYTYLLFEICRRLPASPVARFFARNTLVIFIGHMPLLYALAPPVYRLIPVWWVKKLALVLILYVGLGIAGELTGSILKVYQKREWLWGKIEGVLL